MAYPQLSLYAIFAQGTLTKNGESPHIVSGNWYGATVSGTFTGVGLSVLDSADASNASTQLTHLKQDITTVTSGLTPTSIGTGGANYTFTPGYYTGTAVSYSSRTLTFNAQGDSSAKFFISATSFTFTSSTIVLTNGASAANIFWVASAGFTTSYTNLFGTVICTTFSTTNSNDHDTTITGHIFSTGADTFSDFGEGDITVITSGDIPRILHACYAKGTLILTKRGNVPIEKIKAGDKIVTQGKIVHHTLSPKANIERVLWISHFDSDESPICITKNAFGENYPFQDLRVSPDHCMLIHGKTVRARFLVNGTTIYKDKGDVVYYHLECEKHSAIVANGVLSETYVDLENRHVFKESERIQPHKSLSLYLS